MVWVIDPKTRTIRVHSPDDLDGHTLQETDTLKGDPVLPGWEMSVRAMLEGQTWQLQD